MGHLRHISHLRHLTHLFGGAAAGVPSSLLTGLVAYLKFDETGGDAVDSTGNRTFTENGGAIAAATGGGRSVRTLAASNSQYFESADTGAADPFRVGDTDFTWAGWVNAATLVNYPAVFCKSTNINLNAYALYVDTVSNKLTFATLDSTLATWGSAASTSTWYHVCCWHDSVNNVIGISVNAGTPVTTAYSAGIDASATGAFRVGSASNNTLFWDGSLDEWGFWSRVLTSDERTTLYGGGTPVTYPKFR